MKCCEIMECLRQLSPEHYACDWDNVGLLVGRKEQEVHSIMVALDASMEVIEQAIEKQVDMLITHHPMIFGSIKTVNEDTLVGRKILSLVENHMCYYAMHTNFDIMGSMADLAAERLGLLQTSPLEITCEDENGLQGIGRIGYLEQEIALKDLTQQVKQAFALDKLMVYGSLEKKVNYIAISPGSGRSMIREALQRGVQVLITGDIGHHEGLDAAEEGLCIIDATHYGLEYIFTSFIKEYLKKQDFDVVVKESDVSSPCQFV
ncbi:MAG: Nif3-like dinuclear metal center hexameric protein [Lachnospira sp.]|nr:Nif3-like dinuclear metal center hexameric protein [Lachnospira sp.]